MRTSDVVAELLVGGVLTVIWLTLLAMAVLGIDPVLGALQRGSLPFGVLILIVAYPLGVVFDRVWRGLLKSWSTSIKRSVLGDDARPAGKLFLEVYGKKHAMEFVVQVQNRMRVARASVGSFVMITVSGVILVASQGTGLFSRDAALCLMGGSLLVSVSTFAFWSLTRSYYLALVHGERCPKDEAKD